MPAIYLAPSFYTHVVSGLLVVFAIFILYANYSKIKMLEPYKLLVLIFGFSISIGSHGLSHLGLETIYNYNPLYSISSR